jgi:hypothetical protein
MKRIAMWTIGLAALLCGAAGSALADDNCFYKGTMFSEGSAACQTGTQFRCDDGEWKALGVACKEERVVLSRPCKYEGISFSTGAASCQGGTQFRCEDGSWRNIGVPCTVVGEAPIKIVPSGRTCMFDSATVSNGSTISVTTVSGSTSARSAAR